MADDVGNCLQVHVGRVELQTEIYGEEDGHSRVGIREVQDSTREVSTFYVWDASLADELTADVTAADDAFVSIFVRKAGIGIPHGENLIDLRILNMILF